MNTQLEIESKLNKKIVLVSDSDGANLLFSAYHGNEKVAMVYKSFDSNFNMIQKIRYSNSF